MRRATVGTLRIYSSHGAFGGCPNLDWKEPHMNDQAKTNGKMSLALAGGIGIVGVLLGVLVSHLLTLQQSHRAKVPTGITNAAPTHWKAIINRDSSSGSCTQFAGRDFGSVVTYSYPVLAKGGDSIVWRGEIDGHPDPDNKVKVHVEFPPGQSPFAGYKFDEDHDSGSVRDSAGYGDYP